MMRRAYVPSLWVMLFAAATPLVAGCSVGALGQAVVADECDSSDAKCTRRGFDKPIAVGATLRPDITFKTLGAGAPSMHFEPVDEGVLSSDDGRIHGVAPGMSAVLLVTDDGMVMDLFHVWVKEPTAVELLTPRGSSDRLEPIAGKVELFVGEALRLDSLVTGEGQVLAGDLPLEWKVDKPVVDLLADGDEGRRRLVAVEPGETTLNVSAGKAFALLRIVVRATGKGSRVALTEYSK